MTANSATAWWPNITRTRAAPITPPLPVNDPTWDGKRSYYHYVFGVEPQPDSNGPCNTSVIRKVRKP